MSSVTPLPGAATLQPAPGGSGVVQVPGAASLAGPTTPSAGSRVGPAARTASLTAGAGWRLHDETTTTAAIVDAIDGAKHVVNAEFFGITDAGKGAQLARALEDAARRGVEVNVIADSTSVIAPPFGSFLRLQRRLEDAGASVVVAGSPLGRVPGLRLGSAPEGARHVDHRKVVTVDGTRGFVGGMNFVRLTDGYRDTMVELGGVAAARLAADQLDRWTRASGAASARHAASVEQALAGRALRPADPREIAVLANAPEQQRFELSERYVTLIRGARERLWLSSPGFSDQRVIAELERAAERGVDVRIVASGAAPLHVPIVNWVGRSHLRDIASRGGSAFEIPEVAHRKLLVADDEAIVSSYNLTGRSRRHDHEVGVATREPGFVQAVAGVLERDIARATRIDPAARPSIGDRIGDLIAQRLRISY